MVHQCMQDGSRVTGRLHQNQWVAEHVHDAVAGSMVADHDITPSIKGAILDVWLQERQAEDGMLFAMQLLPQEWSALPEDLCQKVIDLGHTLLGQIPLCR